MQIADFGLSRPLGETPALGTLAYSAPETLAVGPAGKPADVYSFGVVLWEMLHCAPPYPGLLEAQVCAGVLDGTLRPRFERGAPAPPAASAPSVDHAAAAMTGQDCP